MKCNCTYDKLFYAFEIEERICSANTRHCKITFFENATGGHLSAKISGKQFDAIREKIIEKNKGTKR